MPLIIMERYTLQKRIKMIKIHYKNGKNYAETVRKVNIFLGSLGGYVNEQNWRIWGSENPKMIIEKTLYPQRITVWCGFWTEGIIGPYFFTF